MDWIQYAVVGMISGFAYWHGYRKGRGSADMALLNQAVAARNLAEVLLHSLNEQAEELIELKERLGEYDE